MSEERGVVMCFQGSAGKSVLGWICRKGRLCLELWEEVAALWVNPELAVGLDGHLDLAGRVRCPLVRLVVFALEPVARVTLLALTLLGVGVAHLLAGSHQTTLWDVLAGRLNSIALLVLSRLAMPSALLRVRGRSVLALNHVRHTPGAFKALRIPVTREAGGRASVLELRNSRASCLRLLALTPLFHRCPTLNTTGLTLCAVVPLQIEPARLVGHGLRVLPFSGCHCVFNELCLVDAVCRALGLRWLAWLLSWLLSWLLARLFTWLLGGLSNHQEQQQQDDQVVPPHDVLRA